MNFNFILADGNMVTSSFTVAPLNYPTVNGYKTVDGDIITGSASPATINLLPNNYKIQNNLESTNDWYIAVTTSSFSIISGSTITASLCAVTFNLEDITDTNTSASVAITPIYKNVVYSGSFVMGDTVNHATDPTGSLTVNLVPMPYHVSVTGIYRNTKFKIYPTGSSVNANQCIVTGTNVNNTITPQNNAIYGYTAQASDIRYARSGSNQSASYAAYAVSASYAPNLFPDITDLNGNVGINNNNPQVTLDVNGTIANTTQNGLIIDSYGNDLTLQITNGHNLNIGSFANPSLVIGEFGQAWNIESNQPLNLNPSLLNLNGVSDNVNINSFANTIITAGGAVGINTTTPQYTLDVNGEIGNSNGVLQLGGITWDHTNGWMGINNDTPAALVEVNQGANPNGTIINDGKPRVLWNVDFNNNPSMELHAGNSNVGTKGSAAYIDFAISDNVDYDSRIIQTSNQFILTSNDSILISGNNCGIQNSNPQFALDVTGDINLSGNLKKNGNVFTASLANTASNLVTTNNYTVNNLNVNGTLNASSISSSTVYITSSNLIITDAYAVINAATPHQQYCGIQFYDSGSTTNRSYLTWDGLNDYLFISSSDGGYQRRLILGPDNNGVLTSGYLPVATGSNGLINSVINQSGTTVGIAGTIQMGNANYSASVIAVSGTQSTFTASCGASATLTQFALKAGNGSGQATIKTSGGGLTIDSAGNISGSSIITAPTFIGSLTGTATTASYVTSASYAPTIIPSQLSVTAITASTALHPIGLTMPYSSSLNALTPLVMTGSHYLYTSASVNLMYVYNGSRWCSSSLA